MGQRRRTDPDPLNISGINIESGGRGILINLTIDGAARLVRCLEAAEPSDWDCRLRTLFLERLTATGRLLRQGLISP